MDYIKKCAVDQNIAKPCPNNRTNFPLSTGSCLAFHNKSLNISLLLLESYCDRASLCITLTSLQQWSADCCLTLFLVDECFVYFKHSQLYFGRISVSFNKAMFIDSLNVTRQTELLCLSEKSLFFLNQNHTDPSPSCSQPVLNFVPC